MSGHWFRKLPVHESRAFAQLPLLARALEAILWRLAEDDGRIPLNGRSPHEAIARLTFATRSDKRILPGLLDELLATGFLRVEEGVLVVVQMVGSVHEPATNGPRTGNERSTNRQRTVHEPATAGDLSTRNHSTEDPQEKSREEKEKSRRDQTASEPDVEREEDRPSQEPIPPSPELGKASEPDPTPIATIGSAQPRTPNPSPAPSRQDQRAVGVRQACADMRADVSAGKPPEEIWARFQGAFGAAVPASSTKRRKGSAAAQGALLDLGAPKAPADPLQAPEVTEVLEHWRSRIYHLRAPAESLERRKRIADRLAERYRAGDTPEDAVAMLKAALDGARLDPWLMGDDPKSTKKYTGIETLLRDAEQVERLSELFAEGLAEGKIHADGGEPGHDRDGRLRSVVEREKQLAAAGLSLPKPPERPAVIDENWVGPTGLTIKEIRRRRAEMEDERANYVARARARCTPEELAVLDAAQAKLEANGRAATAAAEAKRRGGMH